MNGSFAEIFDRHFLEYKDEPIAVYGIGVNARRVVCGAPNYNVIGLVAVDHIGEEFYGKRVLDFDTAKTRAKVLIIAATSKAKRIIYDRIKENIPEGMRVFDMWGNELTGEDDYRNNDYWDVSEKDLRTEIEKHDTISFDFFNTLAVRQTYDLVTFFELIEQSLQKQGEEIPYAKWRVEADRSVLRDKKTDMLADIYAEMQTMYGISDEQKAKLERLEYETEKAILICRDRMRNVYEYAKSIGKTVIVTTDTYYTSEQIAGLLENNGYSEPDAIIASCEYGCVKEDGSLYGELKKKGIGKILHIGDHRLSDYEMAMTNGLDAFWIMSPEEMLSNSSCSFLSEMTKTYADRCFLGFLNAHVFNNPFSLRESRGKLYIDNERTYAVSCILGITMCFLSFLYHNLTKEQAIVLFAARDGFYLKKAYEKYVRKRNESLPRSVFFYTSRKAIGKVAVRNLDDLVIMSGSHDPEYNIRDFFRERFSVELSDRYDLPFGEMIGRYGVDWLYKDKDFDIESVIDCQEEERRKYKKYINRLDIPQEGAIVLVDIASKGSTAYGVKRFLERDVKLYAFGGVELPNKYLSEDEVSCLLGLDTTASPFFNWAPVLEVVYASKDGQCEGFVDDGQPFFANDTGYNAELLDGIQTALEEFLEIYPDSDWVENAPSPEFAEALLQLMSAEKTDMSEPFLGKFVYYDKMWNEKEEFKSILELKR